MTLKGKNIQQLLDAEWLTKMMYSIEENKSNIKQTLEFIEETVGYVNSWYRKGS